MARGARFSQRRVYPPYKARLLTLPAELRTRIYDLVLTSPSQIRPPVEKLFDAAEKLEQEGASYKEPETVLSLARVCKQLHDEVLPVYYGNNTFEIFNTYDLYRYLYMIGPERRALIQQMTFTFEGETRRYAFELLGECSSLRVLEIRITRWTTRGSPKPQKDVFVAKNLRNLRAALVRLPIDLKIDVREVEYEYYQDLLCRKFMPEVLLMGRAYEQHFTKEHIKLLQAMLRSDIAKQG